MISRAAGVKGKDNSKSEQNTPATNGKNVRVCGHFVDNCVSHYGLNTQMQQCAAANGRKVSITLLTVISS